MNCINIRPALLEDAATILNLYSYYVTDTTVSFEYTPPSLEEFQERMIETMKDFPYLVAEEKGEILGYAYASKFHKRTAYAWACETTIYLNKNARHLGIGRLLYQYLEEQLKKQNIHNLYACITDTPKESQLFHEKIGYQKVAHFTNVGYKFNQWLDVIWMEKKLQEHTNPPVPFVAISSLP